MYASQFEYHRPTSVQEAVALLSGNPDAKILAGGHSLIPAMKLRLAAPAAIVDIGRIAGLRGIAVNGGATIGAMTSYQDLLDSAELTGLYPVIHETAHVVGDPAVRVRGTLGGSMAHSDPAADFPAVMLALNATVTVEGPNGTRTIAIDDLFVDLLTTSIEADEIITGIVIPAPTGAAVYEKHRHPASGYAVVGVAVALGGSGGTVRIGVTGAGAKATRATAAESALAGQTLTKENIAAASALAAQGIDLNNDVYASGEYRAHLVTVLTKRALTRAAGL